jgi:hypothetical protein
VNVPLRVAIAGLPAFRTTLHARRYGSSRSAVAASRS